MKRSAVLTAGILACCVGTVPGLVAQSADAVSVEGKSYRAAAIGGGLVTSLVSTSRAPYATLQVELGHSASGVMSPFVLGGLALFPPRGCADDSADDICNWPSFWWMAQVGNELRIAGVFAGLSGGIHYLGRKVVPSVGVRVRPSTLNVLRGWAPQLSSSVLLGSGRLDALQTGLIIEVSLTGRSFQ